MRLVSHREAPSFCNYCPDFFMPVCYNALHENSINREQDKGGCVADFVEVPESDRRQSFNQRDATEGENHARKHPYLLS